MVNNKPYNNGVGRLAADRFDFEQHLIGGAGFRHTADQIDMNPSVTGGAATVQSTLANVEAFIAQQSGAGQGFITVGDGYNTWHNANGNNNYDNTIPSLDTLLNPIFNAIITNPYTVPPAYARIANGGIVVIKAGTYIVQNTITIPPGITILGEGFGTKIINATNLNLTATPPQPKSVLSISGATNAAPIVITTSTAHGLLNNSSVTISGVTGNTAANGTWQITVTSTTQFSLQGSTGNGAYINGGIVTTCQPVFRIATDNSRSDVDSPVNSNLFMFSRETKISNLLISDNFVQPTQLGDTYYKVAQNVAGGVPLIEQMGGSYLSLDRVTLAGRANSSSITTEIAVNLNTKISDYGSILYMNGCYVDGFKVPFVFASLASNMSYFSMVNSKVRCYGNLNGDTSAVTNNCAVVINDNNANISNNYIYSNSTTNNRLIALKTLVNTSPLTQAHSKIVVSSNQIVVDKLEDQPALSYTYIDYTLGQNWSDNLDCSITGNTFGRTNYISSHIDGNTGAGYGLTVTPTAFTTSLTFPNITVTDVNTSTLEVSTAVNISGRLNVGQGQTISPLVLNSNITSGVGGWSLYLIDTRNNSVTFTDAGSPQLNCKVIIKDAYGTFAKNPFKFVSPLAIDDRPSGQGITLSTNWASITLFYNGTQWLIL